MNPVPKWQSVSWGCSENPILFVPLLVRLGYVWKEYRYILLGIKTQYFCFIVNLRFYSYKQSVTKSASQKSFSCSRLKNTIASMLNVNIIGNILHETCFFYFTYLLLTLPTYCIILLYKHNSMHIDMQFKFKTDEFYWICVWLLPLILLKQRSSHNRLGRLRRECVREYNFHLYINIIQY